MKLAIIGSALTGGAIQIVDICLGDGIANELRIYDDDPRANGASILGVPVVGTTDQVSSDFANNLVDSVIVAVGSINSRFMLFQKINCEEYPIINIISRKATISSSVKIGKGNVILPNVYIGPNVTIGDNNYITTSSVVNHDSSIGSHCYFSTSVSVAGRVKIGSKVRLDTSCSVSADAIIEDRAHLLPGKNYGPLRLP